ncbi:MAG: 50S ribosomal protein L24 [Candidatus Aenigmarchaeota archaeon]|nr:50S ribosomal protein L24 [Candidatus Aenigmarchaeota archaeon]
MSILPRKQRKALYDAPLHTRQKLVSAHLSKKLKEEFGRRSLAVRKGDKVKVMRGEFFGLMGNVKDVDLKNYKVRIEKIARKKVDGTEVLVPFHPSNLQIIEANMEDKERQAIVKRSGGKITITGEAAIQPKETVKAETMVKQEKPEKAKKSIKTCKSEFRCPVCKSTFTSKTEVGQHIQKTHKEYR